MAAASLERLLDHSSRLRGRNLEESQSKLRDRDAIMETSGMSLYLGRLHSCHDNYRHS